MSKKRAWTECGTAAALFLLLSTPLALAVDATPYPGPARSIGGAANGCLAGARPLPLSGPGWETLRPARNRFWGNPALVAFIEDMAGKTRGLGLGTLQIGDLAQPRGGHMTSGHGSHQTGVDVDILYHMTDGPLSDVDRANPAQDSAVRPDDSLDPARWGEPQTALVKAFASDARVERIFVNAAIKRSLCGSVVGDRAWLRKLRPWWGHDEHFHIRINCPAGDTECIPGPTLPQGDGCGTALDWWFTDEAKHPAAKPGPKPPPPDKPAACRAVLGR